MKRFFLLVIGAMVLFGGVIPVYASTSCATKYPIILVHGMGMKDQNLVGINYWWGIPGALRDCGATVYVTNQDPMNGIAERAQQVANELGEQFAVNPQWTKINIIAHSMGPLDSRHLTTNLSIPGKGPARNYVASLTSISGVNGGAEIADLLWNLDNGVPVLGKIAGNVISAAVNAFYGIFFYDQEDKNCMKGLYNLTTNYVQNIFNPNTPNVPGIMYQSWGGKINYVGVTPDQLFIGPLWVLMKALGAGDNDCLVSIKSAKLGTWRGALTTSLLFPGVNHLYEIGQMLGFTPGFDAPRFYVNVVKELKANGY
ncbi:MAG: hypothetical protein NTW65_11490 [Deltaproteobacteria bacterium]|nr:hypothetical protein [Deltaproteobacteria bacterium]